MQYAHATPQFVLFQAVETMAGRHAGLATRTGIEIDFKGVLLVDARCSRGDQVAVVTRLQRRIVRRMPLRETVNRRKRPLFGEHRLDQALPCRLGFE